MYARKSCLARPATRPGNLICTRYPLCLKKQFGLPPPLLQGRNVPVNVYGLSTPISVLFWVSVHTVRSTCSLVMPRFNFLIFLVSCFARFFTSLTPTTFPGKTLGKPATWPLAGDLTLTPITPCSLGQLLAPWQHPLLCQLLVSRFLPAFCCSCVPRLGV